MDIATDNRNFPESGIIFLSNYKVVINGGLFESDLKIIYFVNFLNNSTSVLVVTLKLKTDPSTI